MRWLGAALLLAVVAIAVGVLWINLVGHDPAVWHVDPTRIERSPSPNDFLAAPPGVIGQPIDRETVIHPVPPDQLLGAWRKVVLSAPRTQIVAESSEDNALTIVQRTPVIGFPHYVSARAIAVGSGRDGADAADGAGDAGNGSALVVWSRSRFGSNDLGVNAERVNRWLDELEPAPSAGGRAE